MSHRNEVEFGVIVGSSDFKIETLNVNQIKNRSAQDLKTIQKELLTLRNEMMNEAKIDEPEHFVQIGKIAAAEKAAAEGKEQGVKEALKGISKWTLDIASKIGTAVVASLITTTMKE
ncbi:hypothetical protein [Priestia aryabhattai]|uniref:hypothetical protein n=1 Tax=Priestia aryabhattai TaxID=412384 RepID=UPI003D2B6D43